MINILSGLSAKPASASQGRCRRGWSDTREWKKKKKTREGGVGETVGETKVVGSFFALGRGVAPDAGQRGRAGRKKRGDRT